MKTHKTIKSIRENYKKIFRCGYADLQYIMVHHEPYYYNAGVYGWNCDIYTYGLDLAITTGYRNMTGRLIPNELIEKYSDRAKEILESKKHYETIREEIEQNMINFFEELKTI